MKYINRDNESSRHVNHLSAAGSSRRRFLESSAAAGAALSLVSGVRASGENPAAAFPHEAKPIRIGEGSQCVLRFAHLTDTHYYVIDETHPNHVAFEKYMKWRMGWHTEVPAADVYAELQRRKVEFAVHTGDIIDYSTDEDRRFFERMCGDIPFPVHYCLGNHDYQTLKIDSDAKAQWGFLDETANVAAWKKQVSLFTDRNYTFVRGGYRFIFLDNALRKFDDGQLRWLDAQLDAASGTPCILSFHIPLYSKHLEDVIKNVGALMPAKGDIYGVLACHDNVAAVFAGHVHRSTETKINGIPQYTTDAAFHRAFRMVECFG